MNGRGNSAHAMGLGLAILQRLGDLLGYTVDVRSRVGRGSVFSIDVPLASESRPVVPRRSRRTLGQNLPALVLTGDMSTETLGEISRQGYIHRSKPVDGHDLTSLIQSLLPKNP